MTIVRLDRERAHALVARHIDTACPGARSVLLTGSVARGTVTSTSDVDLVVLLAEGEGARRETLDWDGTTVDLFAYDSAGLDRWLAKDTERRRPVLCSLILDGVLVAGDPGAAERARAAAATIFAAGPRPTSAAELARMRYCVTDLLLDLEGSADRAETLVLAAALVHDAGDLLLAAAGRWTGSGKWLIREIKAYDQKLAGKLARAHDQLARHDDKAPLLQTVDTMLDRHGGRLLAGRAEVG